MNILTRDDTEHDIDYVTLAEAQQEIDEHRLQVLKLLLSAYELRHALHNLIAEYEDRQSQYGSDYIWQKHEDKDVIAIARDTYNRTAHLINKTP